MKRILLIGIVIATATFSGCYYYGPCLNGSGRIVLKGDVEVAEYSLNSSGRIDALGLLASDVDATITGSGDNIYRGNPQVSTRITGFGSVRSY